MQITLSYTTNVEIALNSFWKLWKFNTSLVTLKEKYLKYPYPKK